MSEASICNAERTILNEFRFFKGEVTVNDAINYSSPPKQCDCFGLVEAARPDLDLKFDSVMVDGSRFSLVTELSRSEYL